MKEEFIVPNCTFGFCPGCGHGNILRSIEKAAQKMNWTKENTVIVTDIGCVGLSDQYFDTSSFHGLHGRSVTYATGLKLANPNLNVVTLIGDGGVGIGLTHLVNAARKNIDINVIVFNNFNFGMTGGSHSVTTPFGYKTLTTPKGNTEYPLDIIGIVNVCKPSFSARSTIYDKNPEDLIVEAFSSKGFAIIDIWEFCTAHFVPLNKLNRKGLLQISEDFELEFGKWKGRVALKQEVQLIKDTKIKKLKVQYSNKLLKRFRFIIAGSAGEKIISSFKVLGEACIESGLNVSQKNDYPITVMTGHSVTEMIIDPNIILYSSFNKPDVLVVTSIDGLDQVRERLRDLDDTCLVIIEETLSDVKISGKIIKLPIKEVSKGCGRFSMGYLCVGIVLGINNDIIDKNDFFECLKTKIPNNRLETSIEIIKRGISLVTNRMKVI